MVRLEEVEDEEFNRVQIGEKDFDDDDFTDTGEPSLSGPGAMLVALPLWYFVTGCGLLLTNASCHPTSLRSFPCHPQYAKVCPHPDSEISDDGVVTIYNGGESLKDRVLALRDMLPPSTRRRIVSSFERVKGYAWYGLTLSGKTAWVVSTSALLLGVPFILAVVEEQQVVEAEKEQRMREMGNEVSF